MAIQWRQLASALELIWKRFPERRASNWLIAMERQPKLASKRPAPKRAPERTPEIYWLGLAGLLLLCLAAAGVSASFSTAGLAYWYPGLAKPLFAPPPWMFAPIWMTLDVMAAIAAWRVWIARDAPARRPAMVLFAIQLLLSVAWPMAMFTLRLPAAAAIEVGVLWLAVLATTTAFFEVSRLAALLMTPMLLWTTFAAILTVEIWRLNG
jgi:translocator protein